MNGDQTVIERALTNLVQNATSTTDGGAARSWFGSRRAVEPRSGATATASRLDEREQILEPFRRPQPGGRGAGLGLDLVQSIMRLHGGRIEVDQAPSGGACMRMVFFEDSAAMLIGRPQSARRLD